MLILALVILIISIFKNKPKLIATLSGVGAVLGIASNVIFVTRFANPLIAGTTTLGSIIGSNSLILQMLGDVAELRYENAFYTVLFLMGAILIWSLSVMIVNSEDKTEKAIRKAKKAERRAKKAQKEAKKAEMDAKEGLMNDADRALAQAERDEEQAKDQLESILSLVETMKSQLANHKANVEAFNAAQKDVAEAVVAQNIAWNALTVKNNEANALWNVIYGNDVTGQIASLEASIEVKEDAIKTLKEEIFDLENSTDDTDLIASQEATIADLEAEIAVLDGPG